MSSDMTSPHRLRTSVLLGIAFLSVLASVPSVRATDGVPVPHANLITLNTTPGGLFVTVNGTPFQTPYSLLCDPATNTTVGAISPQVSGSVRYTFVSWSDGGGASHVISCEAPANITAAFQTEYEIRVESFPSGRVVEIDGMGYGTPATVWCPHNSTVFVNAFQQEIGGTRYTPGNWSDGGAIGHTVVCDAPRTLLLSFLTEYAVGLFSTPREGFTILVDGVAFRTPGVYWCAEGGVHTLEVPSPQTDPFTNSQYAFERWIDNGSGPRTFVCNFSTNYTAVFAVIDSGPIPPPSPFSGLGILAIVLTTVALTVLIPVLLLWWIDRRKPAAASPPPTPVSMGGLPGGRRCPTCGATAAPDWRYCMGCGADLPPL